MKTLIKAVALSATAIAASTVVATPALAQSRNAAPAAPVVATANIDGAIQSTTAFSAAVTQIQTAYAPQIQNRATRAQALQTELQTLGAAVQAEQARQPQNATALQAAVTAYRTREASAQAELQELSAPIELAVTYVREQITLKLQDAVNAATTARRVDMLVNSDAVFWNNANADLTPAITAELNRLVPSVQAVPPAGYQPGMLLRAQAQAAAPAVPAPAAAPTR
jgi:Skp family chaperone for outer membrane proteins